MFTGDDVGRCAFYSKLTEKTKKSNRDRTESMVRCVVEKQQEKLQKRRRRRRGTTDLNHRASKKASGLVAFSSYGTSKRGFETIGSRVGG